MAPAPTTFRITLTGLAALALAMGIGRFAFTPLLPMMQADGLVSIADGGLLAAVHFLGYWLGAVVAARVPCPPRLLLQLSLLAIAASTIGMGLTADMTVWLVLRWLAGVCSAWTLVLVSNYYVSLLAARGRPALQGWIFAGVGTGICIAGLACLMFMAWQVDSARSWQLLGVLSLLTAIVLGLGAGAAVPANRPAAQSQAADRGPLHWRIVIAYGVMGLGYIIPATYLPVMGREIVPDPLVFGWSWPVFGAAAAVSTVFAARLHARYSNRQVWAVAQAVMAAGLLLPVLYPHIATIIAAGLCVGGTFMIITMIGMKEAHRIAPPRDVMRHIAVMTAAFATGQMLGPLFASATYDLTGSFSAALVAASGMLLITAFSLLQGPAAAAVGSRTDGGRAATQQPYEDVT